MTNLSLNCLSASETLVDLARRECAIGFDLRFCRSVSVSEHDRETITCDPPNAAQRHEGETGGIAQYGLDRLSGTYRS